VSSVKQAAQKASTNAADNGASLAIDGISAGGAGTGSKHLTGRARSEHKQSKDRTDRKS
jgi:hypothetical protein